MKVLITGASGFIGSALAARLQAGEHEIVAPARSEWMDFASRPGRIPLLEGVDVVVHCAARAHVTRELDEDPLEAFRRSNVGPTRRLAESCASAGVRRFVYLSSIGVHGNESGDRPIDESSPLCPVDHYAVSKYEAELQLREIEQAGQLELVIVRPTLVYGPGVKGNFLRFLRLADSGVPIPLGAVRNARSFVGLSHLCDLLARCVEHAGAPGHAFVAADDATISTPELLAELRAALGRRPRLWSVPGRWLQWGGQLLGREREVRQLASSLRVDPSLARSVLAWNPGVDLRTGLREMAYWYRGRVS